MFICTAALRPYAVDRINRLECDDHAKKMLCDLVDGYVDQWDGLDNADKTAIGDRIINYIHDGRSGNLDCRGFTIPAICIEDAARAGLRSYINRADCEFAAA